MKYLRTLLFFGFTKDEQWVEFVPGEDYEAFLVSKKENKF